MIGIIGDSPGNVVTIRDALRDICTEKNWVYDNVRIYAYNHESLAGEPNVRIFTTAVDRREVLHCDVVLMIDPTDETMEEVVAMAPIATTFTGLVFAELQQ